MKTKKAKYNWQATTEAELEKLCWAHKVYLVSVSLTADDEALLLPLDGKMVLALNSDASLKRRLAAGLKMLDFYKTLQAEKAVHKTLQAGKAAHI